MKRLDQLRTPAPHILYIWSLFLGLGIWGAFSFQENDAIADFPITTGEVIEFYNAPHSLSLEQILDKATKEPLFDPISTENTLVTGRDRISIWIRLPLTNTGPTDREYALSAGYRWIDLAILYTPDQTGAFTQQAYGEALYRKPYRQERVDPYLSLKLAAGESQVFYLNLQDTYWLKPNLSLWESTETYQKKLRDQEQFIHIYIGLMAGLFLANLGILLAFKDQDLLYYMLFLSATCAVHLMNFNFHIELFHNLLASGQDIINHNVNFYLFYGLLVLTAGLLLLFTTEFLQTQISAPQLYTNTHKFTYALIGIAPIIMFGPTHLLGSALYLIIAVIWVSTHLLAIFLGLHAASKGNKQAHFYLPALALLTLVAWRFNWAIITNDVVTSGILKQWLFASCLEMLLFAFGLFARLTIFNKEKITAQSQVIEEMNQRTQLQARFNQELSETVERRTHSLNLANQQKDRLLTYLAHDMRTPLSGVISLSAMLSESQRDFSTGDVHRYAREIEGSARNVSALMENLLKWGQLESGVFELQKQDYLIQDIYNNVLRSVQTSAALRDIELKLKAPHNTYVFGDFVALVTVLRNLLSNAIKFSPDNSTIRVQVCHLQPNYVEISVIDQGIGLPNECVEKINRQETPDIRKGTQADSGTGLGLSICYQLLALHESQLQVHSIAKRTTRFYFSLSAQNQTAHSEHA